MSEGEDGRPTIKSRRKQTTNTAGEGEETEDIRKGAETEVEDKAETEDPADRIVGLRIPEEGQMQTRDALESCGGEACRDEKGED